MQNAVKKRHTNLPVFYIEDYREVESIRAKGTRMLAELNIKVIYKLAEFIATHTKDDWFYYIRTKEQGEDADLYTCQHSVTVSIYSVILAKRCGLSESEIYDVALAALLHDVGKLIGVPAKVLSKTETLTTDEWSLITLHPYIGYLYCNQIGVKEEVALAVLCHHENLDGTGYYRIDGSRIEGISRILRICDTYDAMTTDRCYHPASKSADALLTMALSTCSVFDKTLLENLVEIYRTN